MTVTTTTAVPSTRGAPRAWLLWTAGFVAFPLSGITGMLVVGRVDGPAAAALGGLATGAVLGAGQVLAGSGRLPVLRWVGATAAGMGVGLLLGAHAVGYGTTLRELALMGALTGTVLGAAQAAVLPPCTRNRWAWVAAMPVLWALGWSVTTAVGVAVDEQFTVFGAAGAITVTALLGLLLQLLLPPTAPAAAPAAGLTSASTRASVSTRTSTPDGEHS